MPPKVPKTTPTRDLEIPKTSSILVVRIGLSKDKVKDDTTLALAVGESQISLKLLPIYKAWFSGLY
jgi:hypothetical protein